MTVYISSDNNESVSISRKEGWHRRRMGERKDSVIEWEDGARTVEEICSSRRPSTVMSLYNSNLGDRGGARSSARRFTLATFTSNPNPKHSTRTE